MEEPKPTEKLTFYHLQHSCGHSVYWSMNICITAPIYLCPWCSGDHSGPFHFREVEDGAHAGLRSYKVQHMANGACCRARPWRRWLRPVVPGQPIPNPHSEP